MPVRVIGPRDPTVPDEVVINTTSRSTTWSRGLSPFFIGPIPLYVGAATTSALNMENAWQFSKVYPRHVDYEGNPTPSYHVWAKAGWEDSRAIRYPMGKGAKPSFSWWAGEKLPYVEARRRIYFPLYAKGVAATPAFAQLLSLYRSLGQITLWDFDGYDHRSLNMTMKEVLNNPDRSMGHAFIIAHLLESLA